jgi:Ca2+-binding RTX toxin-like protein
VNRSTKYEEMNMASLNGTAGKDQITGTSGADVIDGLAGDDTLFGLGGDDQILGGAGKDQIDGGAGNDDLQGGDGDDKLIGGDGNDLLSGGAGKNLLEGGAGLDTAFFSGNFADYQTKIDQANLKGEITLNGVGTKFAEVERLQFADQTIHLGPNSGPSAVSDINSAPNQVSEDAIAGMAVGITASASDADGDSITYSLLDDAGGLFGINATSGVVTVAGALDYETAQSHQISVQASDGNLTSSQTSPFRSVT